MNTELSNQFVQAYLKGRYEITLQLDKEKYFTKTTGVHSADVLDFTMYDVVEDEIIDTAFYTIISTERGWVAMNTDGNVKYSIDMLKSSLRDVLVDLIYRILVYENLHILETLEVANTLEHDYLKLVFTN